MTECLWPKREAFQHEPVRSSNKPQIERKLVFLAAEWPKSEARPAKIRLFIKALPQPRNR